MRFSTTLRQHQSQSLAITAQAIQSIKILQYSQQELHDYLTEQAERNPFLIVEGPLPASQAGYPSRLESGRAGYSSSGLRSLSGTVDLPDIQETHAGHVSLREHLYIQAAVAFRTAQSRLIASEIIENIEPDGYLRRPLWDIADTLGVEESRLAGILETIQGFEPTGVGARNLAECLRLQLVERGKMDAAMERLLQNLPLLASYRINELARLCGVKTGEVLEMVRELRNLDPAPGSRFETAPLPPALPDVLVHRSDNGNFVVQLNPDVLPRALIDKDYFAEVSSGKLPREDRRYVMDGFRNAKWIVNNLNQRAQTVLKVATEVVAHQRAFLLNGIEFLKPLCLKTIADALGIHQSTVCRAIANKYMMTPRGLLEMKFFFAASLNADDDGEDVASETVRHRIRTMIEKESPSAVLSDDAIVKSLSGEGIEIARRTVAKYRTKMNIPSSSVRRRQKRVRVAA